MYNLFALFGAGFVLVLGLMAILWGFYHYRKNSGLVDLGWAVGFLLAAWAYFFIGDGNIIKKFVLTLMATVWGSRLAWHLYNRYLTTPEDPRYQEMRKNWGGDQND